MSIEWRGIGPDDVEAWSRLTVELADADGHDGHYGPDELAEELAEPGVDPVLDVPGVFVDGRLVAFAQVRVYSSLLDGAARSSIDAGVHPDFRGQGLGRRLMDLVEARAGLIAGTRHPGAPLLLRTSVVGSASGAVRLLQHRGYQPARYFLEMQRELPGPEPAEPEVGEGVHLMQSASVMAEPLRIAHNTAFADHWGSTPRSVDEWQTIIGSVTFRPRDSFVCTDEHGTVLSYSCGYEEQQGELTIGQVGTLAGWRGRGLARACLTASLRSARQGDYRLAKLEVDSENPTGAGALYESVGFRPVRTRVVYSRTV